MRRPDRRHAATALAALGITVLLLLLPDFAGRNRDNEGVEAFRARVEAIRPPAADDDPGTPPVPIAEVRVLEGTRAGQVLDAYLSGAGGSQLVADYRVGEEVIVTITAGPAGTEPFVAVSDRWRVPALQAVVLVFAAAVVAVGGWHGLRALIALGFTIALILKVLLPLIVAGVPPIPLAVLSATGITIAAIVLTEGWRRASLAAILGTTGSLALTALLGAAATAVMGFTYAAGSELAFLVTAGGTGLDLRGVLLAAFILGAVGVLDDVTVTQAVLVEELATTGLRGTALMTTAMRVGRAHIAATINTLFLAYVGGGLPLLVVLLVSQLPGSLIANDEVLATEVVRTVAGSLGIVAAVPFTTLIAAAMTTAAEPAPQRSQWARRSRLLLAGTGAVIATLLLATALLPLSAGQRTALTPDTFEPGASMPPAASASASVPSAVPPAGSAEAASGNPSADPSGGPPLVAVDEPAPIVLDGAPVGSVTILRRAVGPSGNASRLTASVLVRYEATAPLDVRRGEWSVLLLDGSLYPLVADGSAIPAEPLPAGETLEIVFSGELPSSAGSGFFVLADARTGEYLLAASAD